MSDKEFWIREMIKLAFYMAIGAVMGLVLL